MMKMDPKLEQRILFISPTVAKWAKEKRKLTQSELLTLKKVYPDIHEFAKKATTEQIIEFNSRHEENNLYGKYLKFLMSPEVRDYLEYLLQIARELNSETAEKK